MDRGKRSEKAELLAVVIVGFLLKLFAGRSSLTENGIMLPGYDEYYHMRRILYTVDHFPGTLWFDSYLNYPHGLNITWPPLFDQVSAALSVVLGQHSRAGIEMVSALVPMLIGSIAIVVVYYSVKELFGGRVALLAAFMTSLAPYYLLYTMFAALDHHCLEVLLQLTSLLFIVMAFSRSEKRIIFAVLAGLTMAALAYTWQGTDVYLGMFLVYAMVKMTLDQKSGSDSRDTAKTLLAAYGVALILVLPFWSEPWMSSSSLGLAAMVVAISVMYAFSRLLAARRLPWTMFPLSLLAVVIVFALISPFTDGLFGVSGLIHSGLSTIWGGEMIGKIGEAEPLIYNSETFNQVIFSALGLNLLLSLAAFVYIAAFIRRSDSDKKPGRLLLLVWAVYTILLTVGQSRFLYISTISMGVMISILFISVLDLVERSLAKRKQKAPKWLAPALLLFLILPTMIDTISFAQSTPPAVAGDWYQSLIWLKDNSNTTSFYDNPDRNGEYSVMSWWDSGNWIVYLSQRPVVANNFQAGLENATKFYLSDNEENATGVLDARGSRYIFTDYDLIYGKLQGLTDWANEDIASYMDMQDYGSQIEAIPTKKLLNTTLARLYLFDGTGAGHFRLIYESPTFLGNSPAKSKVKIFEYVSGALIRVKTGPDQRVGALLNMTSNQGRAFTYVNQASSLPHGDAFEIRVPYSTVSRYETRAVKPYLIFSGNEAGVKMKSLDVSEEDVLKGKTLEVSFSS
jgi:oligosaccharyl transferase (archaeosortase A-associated)